MAQSDKIVAQRYAKALFELSKKDKNLDLVEQNLQSFYELINSQEELRNIINSPVVAKSSKIKIIESIAKKEKIQQLTTNFLMVLIKRGRVALIKEINLAFKELLAEYNNELTAVVTSVAKLSDSQIKTIVKKLEKSFNKTIKIETKIDESILGGLIIQVGSKTFDGSVNSKLKTIELLTKNAIANV